MCLQITTSGVLLGLAVTSLFVKLLVNKGENVTEIIIKENQEEPLSFFTSDIGTLITIILLAVHSLVGIIIEPLIPLPIGGLIGVGDCGKANEGLYCM